jgi:hypothetical protein
MSRHLALGDATRDYVKKRGIVRRVTELRFRQSRSTPAFTVCAVAVRTLRSKHALAGSQILSCRDGLRCRLRRALRRAGRAEQSEYGCDFHMLIGTRP